MIKHGAFAAALALVVALISPGDARADPAPASLVAAALQNILVLDRPGMDGFATIWDGNKYVQCGRARAGGLRCEAAGSAMQPSLARVLTPEKLLRLSALGWKLDPSFGNYVRVFPASTPAEAVSDQILRLLSEAYAADLTQIEVQTAWVRSEPCPPRNGYSQNLAGMIDDAPAMQATALHACAFSPPAAPAGSPLEALVMRDWPRVTAEIQRLRVNLHREVFVIFDADIGYIQCEPQTSPSVIYCEAQSADSWPALSRVLTPDRIDRLHAAGYADPGRAPNYWKAYPVDKASDEAIAAEILALLAEVYGYDGAEPLKIKTETGAAP